MSNADTPTATTPAPPPRNNAWIWFFLFIFVSSIGVTGFMIWFNLSIQLTSDKLEASRKLWQDSGPKSYDMKYTKWINDDPNGITYRVKVRDGKAIEVKQGKELLEQKDRTDDPRMYHTMDALYRDVERFMDIDTKKGAKRVYVTAVFNEDHGAIRKYIRRVMGERERVEIRVEEFEAK